MKKIILITLVLIIFLGIMYFSVFWIQNNTYKKSFVSFYGLENITEKEKPYSFQRCNLNIFKPEFVYLTGKNKGLMNFYHTKNIFSQTKEEWKNSRTGGTTIKNTTFSQLLKMVKEDCYQFQKDYNRKNEDELNWLYSKNRSVSIEEKEKQKKEREKEREKEAQKLREQGIDPDNIPGYTDEELRKILENDGYSQEDIEIIINSGN